MQMRHRNNSFQRSRVTTMFVLLCTCTVSYVATGCTTPVRKIRPDVSPDTLSDTAFLHYLAATPVVTVDEGARGVLLVISDDAASSGDAARRDALARRGMIRERWRLATDSVLDRGTLAFLLCRGLDVNRSFNEWVAERTGIGERRAALVTAVYEGLLAYGPAHESISGGEVAEALARAERWLIEHPDDR